MDNLTIDKISLLFKTISNKTRIEILYLLNEQSLTVSEIVNHLNLDQSLVSHQLKILRETDLVRTKRDGKNIYYFIADKHVYDIFNKAIEHVLEDYNGKETQS